MAFPWKRKYNKKLNTKKIKINKFLNLIKNDLPINKMQMH